MRYIFAYLLIAASLVSVMAQVKNPVKKFTLPQHATASDYQPGKALVKIKREYKALFEGTKNSTARSSDLLGGKIKSLAPSGGGKRNSSARAKALKPVIDITQYFEISFDPARSVEDFINALYATGYVELAEPVYTQRMQFIPNDPSVTSQYYLTNIKAYEAWNITKGSEDIIIGIVDSGVDIDHPDLASQLYINATDPINGVDDDNNGYIDDYRGWDFSGDKTSNASDPNFSGDNDPSINKSGPGFTHGTSVGASASAATNDGAGMAGVGYHSKLLFTKHFADDQVSTSRNYSTDLYIGVLYVASQGANVINCSWGGSIRSQVYQDIIDYVTLDLGCVVVAAAGNDGNAVPVYPAAYDHVLSVAATDNIDKRGSFSSYGNTVDISAPGVSIYTAEYNNNYAFSSGTSFSSPIVAGAAALIIAAHPEFTPLQVAEQLRVTADETMYQQNPAFLHKLGKGRLDILKALNTASPSIRASNHKLAKGLGNNMLLSFDFTNYLVSSSSGLEISISTTSSQVTISKNKINPGSIVQSATVNNTITPFELVVDPALPENTLVEILINYSDGVYQDYQTYTINPNPPYRDIDDNLVKTSVSTAGRLGYQDTENSTNGIGFIFNDASMLYEMGVIMGNSSSTILNTIRNSTGDGYDQDFVSLATIEEIVPGERSSAEIFGEFSNSASVASQTVKVKYRSLVWKEAPYDKFVMIEYKIKNPTASPLTNFYFGIFSDWDIDSGGANDAAGWNAETQLGYVYPKQSTGLPHGGIQLLTESPVYYAIDNSQDISGNPFGIYDGFTDDEKFTSLSASAKTEAGNSTTEGNDVSHVVSAGPFTINANEEITIAFALHGADNFTDLITSAKYADSLYNFVFAIPKPVAADVEICYGGSATLNASGATSYRWYTDFTSGNQLSVTDQLIVSNIVSDTTFYVSNASTNTLESIRTPARVYARANPEILTSRPTTFCAEESVTLSVPEASEYLWNTTETTQSIEATETGEYSVTVKFNSATLNCQTSSETKALTKIPSPTALFSTENNGLVSGTSIQFLDNSQSASTWLWNFDDNSTSTDQNPTHTFVEGGSFTVQLTVTAANGCHDTFSNVLSVITSAEDVLEKHIHVYPVPVNQNNITVDIDGLSAAALNLTLLNAQGAQLTEASFGTISQQFSHTLETKQYPAGLYFLRIQIDNLMIVRKVIITK